MSTADEHRQISFNEVYSTLLWEHMEAMRRGNEPLRERIFQAAETLREIWPHRVAAYEIQFPAQAKP